MKKHFLLVFIFSFFIPLFVSAAPGSLMWSYNSAPPNYFSDVAATSGGVFVTSWQSAFSGVLSIQKRNLDNSGGWSQTVIVPAGPWAQGQPRIAADASGVYVAAATQIGYDVRNGTLALVRLSPVDGSIIGIITSTNPGYVNVTGVAVDSSGVYISGGSSADRGYGGTSWGLDKWQKDLSGRDWYYHSQQSNGDACDYWGPEDMVLNGSSVYLGGCRSIAGPGIYNNRIDKVNIASGVGDWVRIEGAANFIISSLALDASGLYSVSEPPQTWWMTPLSSTLEKRSLNDGSPYWGVNFSHRIMALAIDASGLYQGYIDGGNNIKLDERNLTNGSQIGTQTINSNVFSHWGSGFFSGTVINNLSIDSSGLYIAGGSASTNSWSGTSKIEKYELLTSSAPTVTFTASPLAVNSGSQASLTWGSTNATSCIAGGPWSNSGTLSGSGLTNPLTTTTTFTFQCTGPGGTSPLQSQTVTINPPPSVTLSASPSTIYSGQSTKLTWTSSGAASCNFPSGSSLYTPGGYPANNTSGLSTGPLTSSQSYQISCTGPSGTGNSNIVPVTVLVPTATISASPARIPPGGSTTITWSGTNVSSCTITKNGVVWKTLSGASLTGSAPDTNITVQNAYLMTCTNGVTSPVTTAQTIVNIAPSYREF